VDFHFQSEDVYVSDTESDSDSEVAAARAPSLPTPTIIQSPANPVVPIFPREIVLPPDDRPDPDGRCILLDGKLVLSYRGEVYKEGDAVYLIPDHYGGSKFWIGVIEKIQDGTTENVRFRPWLNVNRRKH
jgi:hypothetical protein